MKSYILSCILIFGIAFSASAQQQQDDAEYTKVLTGRAEKIVQTLGISDQDAYKRVTDIIVNQYKSLGSIHDGLDADIKKAKENSGSDKAAQESAIATLKTAADAKLYNLHCEYIGALSSELSLEQVEKVKDGMTYGVVKVTYDSYCDMVPSLKDFEKRQLMAWLVEAREHAMDAPSSKAKHEWFGKYKGRYNNYLSKQGYDIQKERQEWEKRLKAEGKNL
jgi:hypothetical protein